MQERAGFRRFRGTEDQAAHLSRIVTEDAFQGQKVVVATFIDLQRAFDKVWKDGLLVKLQRISVSGNMSFVHSFVHSPVRADVGGT